MPSAVQLSPFQPVTIDSFQQTPTLSHAQSRELPNHAHISTVNNVSHQKLKQVTHSERKLPPRHQTIATTRNRRATLLSEPDCSEQNSSQGKFGVRLWRQESQVSVITASNRKIPRYMNPVRNLSRSPSVT